jgi:putative GTP pyrophosphokinase
MKIDKLNVIIPEYSQSPNQLDRAFKSSNSKEVVKSIYSFLSIENPYLTATHKICQKLEDLNKQLKLTHSRNFIHTIQSRVKTPDSIVNKLQRKGFELSLESACQNLKDIAGVRVNCLYIDDIYRISGLLLSQDYIKLIRISDYVKNPKPNGYRSLHLIITVPVFHSPKTEIVKVEVQIRTIAMDFWASLEHEIFYKQMDKNVASVSSELKDCANTIADVDKRMQELYNLPNKLSNHNLP